MLSIHYLHVSVCASLLCIRPIELEVSPFGLLNRHQLSFVLQEIDAADCYPRIHKFFMGKLKFRGWWVQSVRRSVPKYSPPKPTINHSGSDKEMTQFLFAPVSFSSSPFPYNIRLCAFNRTPVFIGALLLSVPSGWISPTWTHTLKNCLVFARLML